MEVKIIDGTIDPLYSISNAARMSTRTQDKNDVRTRDEFVRARIRNGEENLLEHAYVQLDIRGISRACLQQLVRHRYHVCYTVESQRYVSQENAQFIIPPEAKRLGLDKVFEDTYRLCMSAYVSLVNKGLKKEDARYLLPEATSTNLIITYNFRGLRHLLRMRCDKKAQWEIRELAYKIRQVVYEHYGTDFFAEGLGVKK